MDAGFSSNWTRPISFLSLESGERGYKSDPEAAQKSCMFLQPLQLPVEAGLKGCAAPPQNFN